MELLVIVFVLVFTFASILMNCVQSTWVADLKKEIAVRKAVEAKDLVIASLEKDLAYAQGVNVKRQARPVAKGEDFDIDPTPTYPIQDAKDYKIIALEEELKAANHNYAMLTKRMDLVIAEYKEELESKQIRIEQLENNYHAVDSINFDLNKEVNRLRSLAFTLETQAMIPNGQQDDEEEGFDDLLDIEVAYSEEPLPEVDEAFKFLPEHTNEELAERELRIEFDFKAVEKEYGSPYAYLSAKLPSIVPHIATPKTIYVWMQALNINQIKNLSMLKYVKVVLDEKVGHKIYKK